MPLIASIFPIVLLIYLMTKRNSMPSHHALPLVAGVAALSNLVFLEMPPVRVSAAMIEGLLTALTPIMIIAGAILLFKTMETTGALDTIRSWLNTISSNQIAQLMIIGWAFTFLIEGASGFGTPAALAAPVLVGLGFHPLSAALITLIMNSVPVSFGAVGAPTWFGFSEIANLTRTDIMTIGWQSALMHSVAAFIIPVIALRFVVDWKTIRKNIGFVYLSIMACVVPYMLVALVNVEFPALLGGFVGLLVSIVAARQGWGLESDLARQPTTVAIKWPKLIKALFPLWATLLLLIITRIPELGIKNLLNLTQPEWTLKLGTFGIFSISPSIIIQLKAILTTDLAWTLKALYVPGILPFGLISGLTFVLYRSNRQTVLRAWQAMARQMKSPVIALFGALVLVNLLMLGDDQAPTMRIGRALAEWFGWGWSFFAPWLGALGSFFSGSNTVSNLTFGPIQNAIALNLDLSRTTILAAQSVGGALGNMVCINNIVAVCSVLGLSNHEGTILKKTVIPMAVYAGLAGIMSWWLAQL